MIINGTSGFYINPDYRAKITLALNWKQWSDGNWRARDRGTSNDVYSSAFSVLGTYTQITDLITSLSTARDITVLTLESGELIFGPHINYSSAMNVAIDNFGEIKRHSLNAYSIDIEVTLIGSPTLISDTVSVTTFKNDLYALKSVEFNQDFTTTWTPDHKRHYDGSYNHLDKYIDIGVCHLTVHDWIASNSANKMRTIVKAIVSVIRSDAFGWISTGQPNAWGPPKPFGPKTPTVPYAKLLEFSLGPYNGIKGWKIDLKFVEHKYSWDGT